MSIAAELHGCWWRQCDIGRGVRLPGGFFLYLTFHIFPDTAFQWFSGSSSSCSCLSVGLAESSAVRGTIRLPRFSLRDRPGVLHDGLLAPLVSSVKCLMDKWMVGWVVYN